MSEPNEAIATKAHKLRVIFDTNVYVSAAIFRENRISNVLADTMNHCEVVTSSETWGELSEVLFRPKFDKFLSLDARRGLIELWSAYVLRVPIENAVFDCRDPKDNKFLALALAGKADFLVTGDEDLLVLNPYHQCTICTVTDFAAHHRLHI